MTSNQLGEGAAKWEPGIEASTRDVVDVGVKATGEVVLVKVWVGQIIGGHPHPLTTFNNCSTSHMDVKI
ncbi:hypothetical protein E2C01_012252 [Portunus trituberculatus]|uniref:Uncharacterized protein n=1 Tax=Portunus trituberculatus TaxID=210409 RepID=A0A5B7DDN2_PORTR|nr:hypothetical protein [Portunus trituberculatus]